MLVTHSFSFFFKMSLFCFYFWGIFSINIEFWVDCFSLKVSFNSPLACIISGGKSAVIFTLLLWICLFPLDTFTVFSLPMIYSSFTMMILIFFFLLALCWVFSICGFIIFTKLDKFLTYSFKYSFMLPFLGLHLHTY